MKRKILLILLICAFATCFAMLFTGCNDNGEVKPHSHAFGDWVTEKSATCTEKGTRYRECTVKNCSSTERETIPAFMMHDYENGRCVRCKEPEPTLDCLNFTLKGDTYKVKSEKDVETIVIPSLYNGKYVTALDSTFQHCSSLKSVYIPKGITHIYNAFDDCPSLTNINIPSSVIYIGSPMITGCPSLESITVDSENTEYHSDGNCFIETKTKKLIAGCKTSVIPSDGSVTSIEFGAFHECTELSSINIPTGVTSIGHVAFKGCSSLTSVIIPNGVTSIGNEAFEGCSSLTSVIIPNGVTSIGNSAFERCSSLTSVTIPNGVTSIGSRTFWGCGKLAYVYIPESVTVIGRNALYCFYKCVFFCEAKSKNDNWHEDWNAPDYNNIGGDYKMIYDCKNNDIADDGNKYFVKDDVLYKITETETGNLVTLAKLLSTAITSFTIPEKVFYNGINYSVTSIGEFAFDGYKNLKNVSIPNCVRTIESGAFADCTSLTNMTIPEGVTAIDNGAFNGCTALKEMTIPGSVVYIDAWAFCKCTSLTRVTILNGVTSIRDAAFYGCTALTSIYIPISVTTINMIAFRDCTLLTIYCEAEIQPDNWQPNWNISNCPIVWGYKEGN